MGRKPSPKDLADGFDRELADLTPQARWREWMVRAEAVIFASEQPVDRDTIARVVGSGCSIDLLVEDIASELRGRPYQIVTVAGGWQHRTRPAYAAVIAASRAATRTSPDISRQEATVLAAIGYFQPVTRADLSAILGREVSRDTIAALRHADYIRTGPRSPRPGAPFTYVTTETFLSAFGLATLRDLPDIEFLEDSGLLSRIDPETDDAPD